MSDSNVGEAGDNANLTEATGAKVVAIMGPGRRGPSPLCPLLHSPLIPHRALFTTHRRLLSHQDLVEIVVENGVTREKKGVHNRGEVNA